MQRQFARYRMPSGLIGAIEAVAGPLGAASGKARAKADDRIVHLLDRATFGYTEEELARAMDLGVEAWLDEQLTPDAGVDNALDEVLAEHFPTLAMGYQELFAYARDPDNQAQPAIELILATLLRQLYSPRQLAEVLVEFWTNHFNVFLFDGPVQYFKTIDDRDHIRPHALGHFGDLLHANARSPAMLYYLDNYSNSREGPNENYARELLELHTLGVDGGYSEHDVKEVARCFTGWTLHPRHPDVFVFDPLTHDWGQKRVLGTTIAPNRGVEDGRRVLDLLASAPETYRNLGRKLARRFIADEADAEVVEAVTVAGTKSGGSIGKMVRTVFRSEAFDRGAGTKYKRPIEYVLSVIRRLGPETGDEFVRVLIGQLQTLGQLPYFASPPTGYPDTRDAWLATSPALARWNFASAVAYGSLPANSGFQAQREAPAMNRVIQVPMTELLDGARSPEAIVDRLLERILHRTLPEREREALLDLAGRGRASDMPLGRRLAEQRGRAVLAALLASPRFQAR